MNATARMVADHMSEAIDSARRTPSRVELGQLIDFDKLQKTATSVAHSALPTRFAPQPRRRWRWPFAGAALVVIGALLVGFLYRSPTMRRRRGEDADEWDQPENGFGPQAADARRSKPDHERDASDVVTGPVGSASLRDPATAGEQGADLDKLPKIDPDQGSPTSSKH